MKGFATARALIIDDNYTEIPTAVCALGRMGIGVIFHHATPDVAATPMEGIHLVFLDMLLGELCADPNDEKVIVGSALERLKALVSPDHTSPLIVCCWTRHTELVDAFRTAFFEAYKSRAEVSSVVGCGKPDKGEEAKTIEILTATLNNAFERLKPFHIVYEWQQLVHSAATQTTGALFNTVEACRPQFESDAAAAYRVLALLAVAEGGKALADREGAIDPALRRTLSSLLSDRLEYGPNSESTSINRDSDLVRAVREVALPPQKGSENKLAEVVVTPDSLVADLNKMLLAGEAHEDPLCPGQIIVVDRLDEKVQIELGLTNLHDDFIKDTLNVQGIETVRSSSSLFLLSIVPQCDFAQQKVKMGLFLVGVLCEDFSRIKKEASFVKVFGPVSGLADRSQWLAINLHFAVSLTPTQARMCVGAGLARLREVPLLSTTHAFSSHASRPGLVRISMEDFHPKKKGAKSTGADEAQSIQSSSLTQSVVATKRSLRQRFQDACKAFTK